MYEINITLLWWIEVTKKEIDLVIFEVFCAWPPLTINLFEILAILTFGCRCPSQSFIFFALSLILNCKAGNCET